MNDILPGHICFMYLYIYIPPNPKGGNWLAIDHFLLNIQNFYNGHVGIKSGYRIL